MKTEKEISQLSGLSDYELAMDKIIDKIKSTESSLECIGILRKFIASQFKEQKLVLPSDEINPRVAKLIIQIRDLFIEAKNTPLDTMEEIWHLLYQIANPNYDKLSDEVWSEIERISNNN